MVMQSINISFMNKDKSEKIKESIEISKQVCELKLESTEKLSKIELSQSNMTMDLKSAINVYDNNQSYYLSVLDDNINFDLFQFKSEVTELEKWFCLIDDNLPNDENDYDEWLYIQYHKYKYHLHPYCDNKLIKYINKFDCDTITLLYENYEKSKIIYKKKVGSLPEFETVEKEVKEVEQSIKKYDVFGNPISKVRDAGKIVKPRLGNRNKKITSSIPTERVNKPVPKKKL